MEDLDSLLHAGVRAVEYAAKLTRFIQTKYPYVSAITKIDSSPVTSADYGAQAIISLSLRAQLYTGNSRTKFKMMGEEDSSVLLDSNDAVVMERILAGINAVYPRNVFLDQCKGDLTTVFDNITPVSELLWTANDIIEAISCDGAITNHPTNGEDYWVLDPVDGTKGFLRRGQYAIGLAYIQGGKSVLSVIACPNLPYDKWNDTAGEVPYITDDKFIGSIFTAIQGKGAYISPLPVTEQLPIHLIPSRRIHTSSSIESRELILAESFESAHTNRILSEALYNDLNIQKSPIRIDSMTKFGLIARGEVHVLLRLKAAPEFIWDQAPGAILIAEAGGIVTDGNGIHLDFSVGRKLTNNKYIVVSANRALHDKVLEALKKFQHLEEE
eukprot:gene664-1282_t